MLPSGGANRPLSGAAQSRLDDADLRICEYRRARGSQMKRTPPSKRTPPGVAAHVALLNARWSQGLSDELRRRVLAETTIRSIPVGGFVCRKGESAEHWIGVLDGL